ncbi:hypothetical protein SLS53_006642 [Cytospora paraplurivora]|uniref:Uncharacterized protein n=1 Tax=Cytospora paraplurivora TaxID=2898453 RepID=A0AAN9YEV7_9PEZI
MALSTRFLPLVLALPFMFFMMGTTSANNLLFFSGGDNCYASTAHIGCYNHPGDVCCMSASPFCTTFQLSNTDKNVASIWAISGQDCNLHDGYKTCTQKGVGHTDCCIDIFGYDTSTCSAFWGMNLGGREDGLAAGGDTHGECVQPNKMVYDDDGKGMREIFLPNGTLQEVIDLYNKKDYAGLGGYKTWEEVMGSDLQGQAS